MASEVQTCFHSEGRQRCRETRWVTRARIGKSLARFESDPFKHAEKLTDPKLGTYRFRIGDYRVIFDVEGRDIVVLRVGHRRELYKRT